jgi:HEAT repeat protein
MRKDDPLAVALGSEDLASRLEAIGRVAQGAMLSRPALDALAAGLGAEAKVVQRGAADALAAIRDSRVVPALRAALQADSARLRWGAAYALSLIDGALDLRALPALMEALSSNDGDVRWAAADLIVRLGGDSPEPVRRGLINLETHADPNARKMAIYCIRNLRFEDPEVCAIVERASRSADAGVRLAALSTLARLPRAGSEGLNAALRCLGSDADSGVRRAAAVALGRIGSGSQAAADALASAADQSADPALSKAARQALARLEQSR